MAGRAGAPGSVSARIVYPAEGRVHRSFAVTGAATLALACCIPGTVPHVCYGGSPGSGLTVHHPEGDLRVAWKLRTDGLPEEISLERSCRLILSGTVF